MDVEFITSEFTTKQLEMFVWLLEQDEELQKSLAIVAAAVKAIKDYEIYSRESLSDLRKKRKNQPIPFYEEI